MAEKHILRNNEQPKLPYCELAYYLLAMFSKPIRENQPACNETPRQYKDETAQKLHTTTAISETCVLKIFEWQQLMSLFNSNDASYGCTCILSSEACNQDTHRSQRLFAFI